MLNYARSAFNKSRGSVFARLLAMALLSGCATGNANVSSGDATEGATEVSARPENARPEDDPTPVWQVNSIAQNINQESQGICNKFGEDHDACGWARANSTYITSMAMRRAFNDWPDKEKARTGQANIERACQNLRSIFQGYGRDLETSTAALNAYVANPEQFDQLRGDCLNVMRRAVQGAYLNRN